MLSFKAGDLWSRTKQSCPVQRRSEEVIISCHITALIRRQHLHHCLISICNSKVQGCPSLIVLPVQQGLSGSCLLHTHTHTTQQKKKDMQTDRSMTKSLESICVCVCAHKCVYQYTADSLRSAGLLAVCCPVQRDLSFAVWNANIGIMLDQKANVLWSVIKC